jgi:hypothetical protein
MIAIFAIWIARNRHSRATDSVPDFYRRFLERMAKAGLPRQPSETPAEFALRAGQKFPARLADIEQITANYYHARFAKH